MAGARWRRNLLRELIYVVVLGAPLLGFYLVAAPRSNAAGLLQKMARVAPGADFGAVRALATHYHAYATCVDEDCSFQFQNRWLHRLHLAPLTQFSVLAHSALQPDGTAQVATVAYAMLVMRDDLAAEPVASALVFDRPAGGTPFTASESGDGGGTPRAVVTVTVAATPRQRARARAFDLTCLTRLGGCKTARELLPAVWGRPRPAGSPRTP